MAKKNEISAAQKAEHETAVENIITHFATTYISPGNDRLSAFQDLCKDLQVEVEMSFTQCKKSIKDAHVNIHDFVRVQEDGGDVSTVKMASYKVLQTDLRKHPPRRFPLLRAKDDELLKAMLIHM